MFYELMLNHLYNNIISKKRQISQTLFEYEYEQGLTISFENDHIYVRFAWSRGDW